MGYTTRFKGHFSLSDRLYDTQVLYLYEFARSRRVKRNTAQLQALPDPARAGVGLPLGLEGAYFVNESHSAADEAILDINRPPAGQPGLWCQWIPTMDGGGIEWDRGEKFYHYVEWLQYLIDHFLSLWGYRLSGEVTWQGESPSDRGCITVVNNEIISPENVPQRLLQLTSPISVPVRVFEGLAAVQAADETALVSYLAAIAQAKALGYPETATWIDVNLERYARGVRQGFEASGRVLFSKFTI